MRCHLFSACILAGMLFSSPAPAAPPVSYHLSFEDFSFKADDWIEQAGMKTIEERKWESVAGKFGNALYLGAVPLDYDIDNMSGLDLDLITAIIFNVQYQNMKGIGYDEPFIWGAGKLHPAYGAVSFWVKGSSKPEKDNARTILFEQTTSGWGRKERQLIEIELTRDRTISAYVEDARYAQHTVETKAEWKDNDWNHVVFMWDRSSGVSLWINGKEAASSMGTMAWWENQRPGLFHLPMAKAAYDEFYLFTRPLKPGEIAALYTKNTPPADNAGTVLSSQKDVRRLKNAFTADASRLPVIKPQAAQALVFKDITPLRIHDEGVQGWWIADGRYELAWPHEYSVFTIIPGDVDFHAEKADVLPPPASDVNYLTFEGNLDGVSVLAGDRNGSFLSRPALDIPANKGFFYGAMVEGLGDAELRVPFTKQYGAPPGFSSDDDVLRLPLSGDLRLHEIGLFSVREKSIATEPGSVTFQLSAIPPTLDDARYPVCLTALYPEADRTCAGLFRSQGDAGKSFITVDPMTRIHLISDGMSSKTAYKSVLIDLTVTSPAEGNILQFRLRDPAVPSHTWTHAEMRLEGFTGKQGRLRVALEFDPVFLVPGDRLWIELMATDGLTIATGRSDTPSCVTLMPEIDWARAEEAYSFKILRPAILTYGRSFEYIPWEWDKRLPDVDAPSNFGGMFDMAYPWQAVLKVNPGNKVANIYKAFTTGDYSRGRYPRDVDKLFGYDVQSRQFDRYPSSSGTIVIGGRFHAPSNAPLWAVYFREFQTFRNRIVTWWRHHQRSDGQAGGGWNDDTLIFSRAFADMPLDSNPDALALYNNVFAGFEKTNYFKDGYCRIYPIDRLHNGDFVRERYKSLIYNPGDPKSAIWAMEEAWHWNKPDKTPINYGNGRGFLFGKDVLEWYWGRRRVEKPFVLGDKDAITETLRKAAIVNNDTTLWRFTEAWCHTDDQSQYGSEVLNNILLGGWGSNPGRAATEPSNITITVGVGWVEGGGPQLGRLVEYSGTDGFRAEMYSFDRFTRKVTVRMYRLDPGTYTVNLMADNDGDGAYETSVTKRTEKIPRFGKITLEVPSRIPVHLEVTQESTDPSPGDLPDLAVVADTIALTGDTLKFSAYNIGSAQSGECSIEIYCPAGNLLKRVKLGAIEGSADYVPKKLDVTVTGLPARSMYRIVLDSGETVKEIFEGNNVVEFVTGSI